MALIRDSTMTRKRSSHKHTLFIFRHHVWVSLFLITAILTVYWQAGDFEFVGYDDPVYLTGNPHVQAGLTWEGITWAFTASHGATWQPVVWLSYMLGCEFYGLNAGWHHLTNVLFHTASALLLFLVLRRMTGGLWQSAFVAALFALHPLQVESVAWVSERKGVLSTFFWMLTIWSYLRYVDRPKGSRYLLVLLFFLLGLMSKPMLVTLPFVLLLLDYWPLSRFQFGQSGGGGILRLVWEKIPLFALVAVSGVVTFLVQEGGGAISSLTAVPLGARISNALVSYIAYLGKMIWPHHLAVLYPYPEIIPAWQVAGACLVLLAIASLAIKAAKRHPYLAVGWLWYMVTLVPVIGVVKFGDHALADRFTYIPLIGIFIIIAWGVPELLARWRYRQAGLAAITAALLFILMPTTGLQVRYWTNTITLFEHALAVTANNATAHYNLGIAWVAKGKIDESIGHYTEALRIAPDSADAHNNLGRALERQGEMAQAVGHYIEALRIDPRHVNALNNLGLARAREGNLNEAVSHYLNALRVEPENAEAHNNLGIAMASQGRLKEAIGHYLKALQAKPDFAKAHNNLGNALAGQGKIKAAIGHYLNALGISPDFAEAHINLGNALAGQGKLKEAMGHYSEALRIKPDFSEAHNSLGNALASLGKLKEAASHYLKALQYKPDFPEAHNSLGNALARQGRLEEAIRHYLEALRIKPSYANAHYNMGNALASQGNLQEAVSHFSEALRLRPDFEMACRNLEHSLRLMDKSARPSNAAARP